MSKMKRFLEDLIEKLQSNQKLTTLEAKMYTNNKDYIDACVKQLPL